MNVIYVSGSPRRKSNTDYLLNSLLNHMAGEFVKLADYTIEPCHACWACREHGNCTIDDDMTTVLIPRLFDADVIVIGTPVYFNNVTAQLKAFIDRTWSIRGRLKNKIGAAVVVGKRYGAEGAITAIHAFFLKHNVIVANRGISGIAFEPEEIENDIESMAAVERLRGRILGLYRALKARDTPAQYAPGRTSPLANKMRRTI